MHSPTLPPAMRVELYSHGMRVYNFTPDGKRALYLFSRTLARYGYVRVGPGKFVYQMVKIFGGRTASASEFRFHRNLETELRDHLRAFGFDETNTQWTEKAPYEPVRCEFPLITTKTPRDEQPGIIDYMVAPGKTKVVTMQTGRGKTACSLWAISRIGQRTVLTVAGKYVEKWKSDVQSMYGLKPGELMVVRGSKDLQGLFRLALDGALKAKFIIITTGTMMNYLKAYEQFNGSDVGYGVLPEDMYEVLGVGVRLIDEVHEDFHLNHRQDIYANVPKTLSLSATLDADDKVLNRMYEVTFPLNIRPPKLEYDKYIELKCLRYSLNYPNKIRCKNAMKQYSHVKFEQSIMRHPVMLDNYLKMVESIVDYSYMRVREQGQKFMIFFATIELATMSHKRLKNKYPSLNVVRYVGGDDYQRFLEADISCTTLKSAGTAVDVDGLRQVLNTVNLSSKQGNGQAIGRLRRMKDWPTIMPEFLFLSAREIDAHRRYAEEKSDKLGDKILSYKVLETDFRV